MQTNKYLRKLNNFNNFTIRGLYKSKHNGAHFMKYIVFEYVGKGALYLVPESDKAELSLMEEYASDYPGSVEQIGVLESSLQMGSHWWNVGKRPERLKRKSRLEKLRSRNADNL